MGAVAEFEAGLISERTKAALQAAKARGVKLGNPALRAGDPASALKASQKAQEAALERAAEIRPYVEQARAAGAQSLAQIARALEARGIRTPRGKANWSPAQVARLIAWPALRPTIMAACMGAGRGPSTDDSTSCAANPMSGSAGSARRSRAAAGRRRRQNPPGPQDPEAGTGPGRGCRRPERT